MQTVFNLFSGSAARDYNSRLSRNFFAEQRYPQHSHSQDFCSKGAFYCLPQKGF